VTIAAAGKLSDETGKPVLAFFTADWCGPCQVLKRTSLVDPRVEALIDERMIAVYIDGDAERELVARARVRGYPATMVLIQGKEVARVEGVLGPDEYLNWLTNAADQAVSAVPFPGRAIQSPDTPTVTLW
jgi:protein disulfide-isomerase